MKLLNFGLSQPSFATELLALGYVWDLHNCCDFVGLTINADDNSAVMTWTAGGHPATMYSGCSLIFRGLKQLFVSPRDEELPLSEDTCVSGISKLVPNREQRSEYRVKREWDQSEPFHLFLEFQGRRGIEIDAESAELVGIAQIGKQPTGSPKASTPLP